MSENTRLIQKRSGEVEEFDRNKVFNSLLGATATPDQAEDITKKIEEWITGSERTIFSIAIREKVIDLLGGVNPQAASLYEKFDKER